MPVSVSIPTKLRIDYRVLTEHPEWIDDALSAAVGRAMTNSRKKILEPRGEYYDICLHTPTFNWTGLHIGQRDRAQLESRWRDVFNQLAKNVGIDKETTNADVAAVLPPEPAERFDPERGTRILELYTIDSYQGGQADVESRQKHAPRLFDIVEVIKVTRNVDDPEAIKKFNELLPAASSDRPLGIIFRYASPGVAEGWQVVITDGQPGVAGAFHFSGFNTLRFQGEHATPMFANVAYVPGAGHASAELLDLPGDVAGRREFYKTQFGDVLGAAIRRQFPKKVSMTTTKYNQLIDDAIAKGIDEGLQRVGKNVVKAIKVILGNATMILWMTQDQLGEFRWQGKARLTPITKREVRIHKETKHGGEIGGTGTETRLRYKSSQGGTSPCPNDEVPREKWGGFMDEPALEEIGDAGVLFQKFISRIASRLGMNEGKYAGQFCIDAARVLKGKADATQSMSETATGQNKPTASNGNLGNINFVPGGSSVIRTIREYADIVADLNEFIRTIDDTFFDLDYACAIHGMYRGNGAGWCLHFLEEVVPIMRWVVYYLFVAGCRSMLLQLLKTSYQEIEKRQKAMDRYAPLFEKWILPSITDIAELQALKDRINAYEIERFSVKATMVVNTATGQQWLLATVALVESLSGPNIKRSVGIPFEIVTDGDVIKIRDMRGVLWSKDDLNQAMALKRGTVEGIDPLVKQIQDTPDAVAKFKDATSIRRELEKLLDEMASDNVEMQYKTYSEEMFGFGASQRSEDIPHATVPYSKYRLGGIHKITNDQIADAFRGSRFYPEGIDFLFDSEEGKAALEGFGIMVGLIALSVFVPGGAFLAFGAGVGIATHEVDKAYEKKRLYRALINPDMVLSYADVEVGIFVAWFGLALSLIPAVGTTTKGLISGGRAIIKGEIKSIGTMAGKAIAKAATKELVEYAAKDLLQTFLSEAVMNLLISEIIQQAMTPILQHMQEEIVASRPGAVQTGTDPDEQAFIHMIKTVEAVE